MKELVRERVQYATRQQCCKTHKTAFALPLPFLHSRQEYIAELKCVNYSFPYKVISTDPANIRSIKLNCDGLFRIDRQPVFFCIRDYLVIENIYKIIN
jgi:hypothetical protein